jgi:hypothetical protein
MRPTFAFVMATWLPNPFGTPHQTQYMYAPAAHRLATLPAAHAEFHIIWIFDGFLVHLFRIVSIHATVMCIQINIDVIVSCSVYRFKCFRQRFQNYSFFSLFESVSFFNTSTSPRFDKCVFTCIFSSAISPEITFAFGLFNLLLNSSIISSSSFPSLTIVFTSFESKIDLTDGQKILNTNLRIRFPSCFISLKRPDLPYILSPAFTLFIGTDLFNCLFSYESAKIGITPYANPCIAVYLCCN